MKVATQFHLASLISVAALALAIAVASWQLSRLASEFSDYNASQKVVVALASLKATALGISRADPILEETGKQLDQADRAVATFAGDALPLLSDTDRKALNDLLKGHWNFYLKQFRSAVTIAATSPTDAIGIPDQIYQNELVPMFEVFDRIVLRQQQQAGALETAISQRIQNLLMAVLVPLLLAALFVVGSQQATARRLVKRLHAMQTIGAKLRQGYLHERMPEKDDELGELARALNHFVATLYNTLTETRAAIASVRSESSRLAQRATQINDNAHAQQDAMTEITQELSVLRGATQDVGTLAEQASDASRSARQLTEEANRAGQNSLNQLQELDLAFSDANRALDGFSGAFGRIVGVSGEIRTIADQTNLLALNAAIEAARAGEAGRGFSVVADEVRKLSQLTAKSTSSIQDILNAASQENASTLSAVRVAGGLLRSCADEGANVAERLGHITATTESVNGLMRAIADAVEQQQHAAGSIYQRSSQIQESAVASAENCADMQNELRNLAAVADRLEQGMLAFQLDASASEIG